MLSLALIALLADAPSPLHAEIDRRAGALEAKVVAWRRDFHQHPEVGFKETRTAGIVARHLRALGLEVKTGVGRTGVVGIVRGGRPGGVVALRADMDALPINEENDLPFRSRNGAMHACAHDGHTAILMGVAELLAAMRAQLNGTVKLLFQPAEEGVPGQPSGAALMLGDGALEGPRVEAIFGLHLFARASKDAEVGTIAVRAGPWWAASDRFEIQVRGRGSHGATPWAGVDPVVTAAQIVLGLQTIVSRQVNMTAAPAVITVGRIAGGTRPNILPDTVDMEGTIRTFEAEVRADVHSRIKRTAQSIAAAAGATAEVRIEAGYPALTNDAGLVARFTPTLRRVAGDKVITDAPRATVAEDFAFFQQKVPGLYVNLGANPRGVPLDEIAGNHSPRFRIDEAALPVGVRLLAHLAVDYLLAPR